MVDERLLLAQGAVPQHLQLLDDFAAHLHRPKICKQIKPKNQNEEQARERGGGKAGAHAAAQMQYKQAPEDKVEALASQGTRCPAITVGHTPRIQRPQALKNKQSRVITYVLGIKSHSRDES